MLCDDYRRLMCYVCVLLVVHCLGSANILSLSVAVDCCLCVFVCCVFLCVCCVLFVYVCLLFVMWCLMSVVFGGAKLYVVCCLSRVARGLLCVVCALWYLVCGLW